MKDLLGSWQGTYTQRAFRRIQWRVMARDLHATCVKKDKIEDLRLKGPKYLDIFKYWTNILKNNKRIMVKASK